MKRFIVLLCGILALPAFAEVAPIGYYDDMTEYSEDYIDEEYVEDVQTPVIPVGPASANARNSAASRTASRAIPANTAGLTTRTNTPSRAVASRNTVNAQPRNTVTPTASRAVNTQQTGLTSRRVAEPTANTARAGTLIQTDTVNTPLYTGRVAVRGTAGAVARTPTIRVSNTATTATPETIADAGATMDEIAQLTDFCRAQYTQCMDNFCAVLDDNQGRCSCSANIKNYAKSEEGLKRATEELQDVAQKIQYLGLTRDEVESLFTQTEAEAAMQGRTDNSQLKNDLDRVKGLLFDVKTGSTTSFDSGMSIDLSGLLDFSFDNNSFDLGALFGGANSTNSISNQRGAELYKTATSRCKATVLDNCKKQGVDASIITNGYDLEIDKQCIAYERSLDDANLQMSRTVRNAKGVLQKARLVVTQQKNTYDLRGCINAVDSCMQDDFVCGGDYENCLDASGKYIVNGEVVIGSKPGIPGGGITDTSGSAEGLYSVWNYNANENAWGSGSLNDFITKYMGVSDPRSTNMVGFLEQKIGYNENGKNFGMCVSVLNKCQDITYNKGSYQRVNKAIEGYMQRTLVQIKAKQDEVLSKYAEGCISDVMSCLSANGYSENAGSVANKSARAACDAMIRTCASATGNTEDEIVESAIGETTQFVIRYNFNSKGAKWTSGFKPLEYYDKNLSATLPITANIDFTGSSCTTFDGWTEVASDTLPYTTVINPGTTGSKTFYLQCH